MKKMFLLFIVFGFIFSSCKKEPIEVPTKSHCGCEITAKVEHWVNPASNPHDYSLLLKCDGNADYVKVDKVRFDQTLLLDKEYYSDKDCPEKN